ncbi:MAG: B12-binding domain-containing radical SAM protein [Chloroflexi bacterium]|nr:B12-binding domain-containing radical SAM protein [Chloroflexota bacterium]MBU1748123.1 B12-binding domain-containing radical SAM protein [Chloroflexota bacterium]MBU1878067.1 B12-binding domain-containing radical SAM protein [Chloroflexota bacterium]
MRILFIVEKIEFEPLGILQLSSILKRAGHDVKLVIAADENPVAVAKSYQPRVVGYTAFTGTQHFYLQVNRRIKEEVPGVFSVFGGPHPTFFPEMIEETGVDGICLGEGEDALPDLVTALDASADHTAIPNWWFKVDGRVVQNDLRPLIADLDALPFLDRALLYDIHPISRHAKNRPMIMGRGCPFNCSYCFNHAYFELYKGKGKRIRQRSVDNVIEEYAQLQAQYPFSFVIFTDDTFIVSREWLREFAGKWPAAGGAPFHAQVRANLVNDEITELLVQAGCQAVGMGVESGNDYLRNEVLNRNLSREQITRAAGILNQHRLALITTTMLGLPKGSLATDLESLELNVACRPAYAATYLYQPYPRTRLGEFTKSEGLLEGSFDDIIPSAVQKSVLKFASPQEKHRIEHLQNWFAIGVEWPALVPLIRQIIKLPKNPVSWLAYKLWKGYALRRRIHPYPMTVKEFTDTVRQFMAIDTH